jgi:anaerobic magnesium-protoporphyrin IX monomethyl ester cyclase
MKLLLTHAYFLHEDVKEQKIMRPYPPLGILSISAYLEQNGIEIEIYDTTFSDKNSLKKYLLQERPIAVGIYVNLMTKLNTLELIHFIKENIGQTKIILGGPEVTYSAENFLRYGADFVVIGEGEQTMLELCSAIFSSNASFNKIDGIAYLEGDRYVQTAGREKIKSLDELPFPARHKINLAQYLDTWKKRHGQNAVSISTMRGCPYTCKWCSRAVYGLSYRRRSPVKVVEEMEEIKHRYNPDSLWFVDDVFTISHKWLTELAEEIKRKKILIPYECITRADRMNEHVIRMLKETGCFRVWIGAESGSQKVIDLMDRRVDVEQVRVMIQQTKAAGIETGTFIMLGYPGESEQDIEETIHHLKQSNPDYFTITIAYPIKGTELHQEVEVFQTAEMDWATSTDRQIDFKRTYPAKYYAYAVRRVVNEVSAFKALEKNQFRKVIQFKSKSLLSKTLMTFARVFQ